MKTENEAHRFFVERYASCYQKDRGYRYAICLKEDDQPIGYVNVSLDEAHDLGYGLLPPFQGRGIVTEAARPVVEQVREDGLPFITATCDVYNSRSGAVMKRLGMVYAYSYEEWWLPKCKTVTFRMYQKNLSGQHHGLYRRYWDESTVRYVERGV